MKREVAVFLHAAAEKNGEFPRSKSDQPDVKSTLSRILQLRYTENERDDDRIQIPLYFRDKKKRPAECLHLKYKLNKEAEKVAVNEKIRVRLMSYEHTLVDAAAEKVVDVAKKNGAEVSGPIPLPTEKEIITILRAVHKYKDSREQFEQRTHKRLVEIVKPSQKVVEALMALELPAGVDIDLKL